MAWRGKPEVIRCDNGPEYIRATLLHWASSQGIRIEQSNLESPSRMPMWSASIERFATSGCHSIIVSDLDEVREFATQWMWRYNHERPNMALGGMTPKQRLAMAA